MKPKVSIIVPSYNDGKHLESLMRSILQQSFSNYEVLVIDGGSTDDTKKVVKKYQDQISFFISEKDKGIFDAMNKGIEAAVGEWLFFIGCDDSFYDKEVLSKVFSFEKESNADVLYGKIYNEAKDQVDGEQINSVEELMTKSLWHQAIFYKKTIFQKTGLYNIKYKISADVVFNLSTYTQFNFNWVFVDEVITRFSGEGVSSEVLDVEYHNDQKGLYFSWFSDLPEKMIYDGLQHHVYNEIRQKRPFNAFQELLVLIVKTGKVNPYLKNAIYYLKREYLSPSKK